MRTPAPNLIRIDWRDATECSDRRGLDDARGFLEAADPPLLENASAVAGGGYPIQRLAAAWVPVTTSAFIIPYLFSARNRLRTMGMRFCRSLDALSEDTERET